MQTSGLDLLDRSLTFAHGVLRGIPSDRLSAATPCPGYTVEALAAHVIGGLDWFAVLPLGGPRDPRGVTDPTLDGESLGVPFRRAAGIVRSIWSPRRVALSYDLPRGMVSGEELVDLTVLELLGHGWDLAVGAGLPNRPDDQLARAGLAAAERVEEKVLRAPGMMGDPIPVKADAPALDRFVAFLGRDPAVWA